MLIVLLVAFVGQLLYRHQYSCLWAARDYTHFSLKGDVKTLACELPVGSTERIVLQLDSASTTTASAEAAGQDGFHRIESLSADSVHNSAIAEIVGKHGWYFSTIGQNPNQGYTLIVLDEGARIVRIVHAPF